MICVYFQAMAQLHAFRVTHNARAGTKYDSLLDAGRTMLKEKYPGYLQGISHAFIPPIFVNVYPEPVNVDGKIKPGPNIDVNDKQLKGATINKMGEDLEALVFRRFEQVLHPMVIDSPFKDCHLLWKGFTVVGYKVDALLDGNPGLKQKIQEFRKKYTTKRAFSFGETDLVVLVKNVGLVVIEVKQPLTKIMNGAKQCHRMAHFSSLVFETSGSKAPLPVVKVVVVGESSTGGNTDLLIERDEDKEVWIMYKGATETMENFQHCWNQVVDDLQQSKRPCQATSEQFDDFAATMTGLWSMVVFNRPLECIGKLS